MNYIAFLNIGLDVAILFSFCKRKFTNLQSKKALISHYHLHFNEDICFCLTRENVTSTKRKTKPKKKKACNFEQNSFKDHGMLTFKILFCKIDEAIKNRNARVKMRVM